MAQLGDNLPQPLPLQQPAQPAFFFWKMVRNVSCVAKLWAHLHLKRMPCSFCYWLSSPHNHYLNVALSLLSRPNSPTICPMPVSESSSYGMVSMLSGMLLYPRTAMAKVGLGSLDNGWTQYSLVNSIYSSLAIPLFTVVYLRACYNQIVDFWASYLIVDLVCWGWTDKK